MQHLVRSNLHCDGLITIIITSANVFINDLTLTCPREKKQFGPSNLITIRPVHSLKVLQLSPDVDYHPTYSKFEIILLMQRVDSIAKSKVVFILEVLRTLTLPLLTDSLQSVLSIKHM